MKFIIFVSLLICTGCTMVSYLSEQGIEQMKIQWNGIKNEEFLDDPHISNEFKHKVMLVGEYKKFFYNYFKKKPTGIYSKTTMLPSKAVTYLVIASPHYKIEAHEFKFPLMGNFPYIGFFKKESAEKFAERLNSNENLVTYVRPVYAYSSLGYFEDRILSSFFHYDDIELAELVFHELFHTVFFIKDEVDLNENLANLFGKELLYEYFKDAPSLKDHFETQKKKDLLSDRVVDLIGILQNEFEKLGGFITDKKADILTKRFVNEVFLPELNEYCFKLKLPVDDCDIREEWNQASFAAFLTYEENQDFLKNIKLENNFNLHQFLGWLKKEHKIFESQKKIATFTDYLKIKSKVEHAPFVAD